MTKTGNNNKVDRNQMGDKKSCWDELERDAAEAIELDQHNNSRMDQKVCLNHWTTGEQEKLTLSPLVHTVTRLFVVHIPT